MVSLSLCLLQLSLISLHSFGLLSHLHFFCHVQLFSCLPESLSVSYVLHICEYSVKNQTKPKKKKKKIYGMMHLSKQQGADDGGLAQ